MYNADEILTAKEVAEYLKINERTIYKLAQNGKIPTIKIAHQWRFRKSMVDSWLDLEMSRSAFNNNNRSVESNGKEIKLSQILMPAGIHQQLKSETKHDVLKEMTDLFCDNYKVTSHEKFFQAVLMRERLCTTAIYDRVALPHPRYNGEHFVQHPALTLGHSSKGIDFDSLDGNPTHLFLMFCAPTDAEHLQTIAKICRLLTITGLKEKLINARSPDQILAQIKHQEELGKI